MRKLSLLCTCLFLLLTNCDRSDQQISDSVENTFYELRIYHAAPGKLDDLHDRFRNHTLRLFEKHGMTNLGYWVPVENTDNQLYFVLAYPSREARESSWAAFTSDPEWIEARAASEANGRLVSSSQSIYMEKTDYSPEIAPQFADNPRLFEFRIYKATPGNLDRLHARFRDHTIGLFSKHGIEHFGYWSPADEEQGADDTLIYFMSHKDADAREASFAGFRADPDWLSARAASEEDAGGSLTVNVDITMMKATDYSPTR